MAKGNSKLHSRKRQKRYKLVKKIARILVVLVCIFGFMYQAREFLMLYWTYPTVVDIQRKSPSYLDIPAFTICNPTGYHYAEMCTGFTQSVCFPNKFLRFVTNAICEFFKDICFNFIMPPDFQIIAFTKFLADVERFSFDQHDKLRVKLEDYMSCSIEFAGSKRNCNMENVMGSFYTEDTLPHYCYTLYSLWGKPNEERERIPRGAIIKFHFYLNASRRASPTPPYNMWSAAFSTPTSPYVQIAVHSPYFLPSPFQEGINYQGGKSYKIRVTMNEKHLLPLPYHTNCTDYRKEWRRNGGRGPINELGIFQKCRVQTWYEAAGCVPVFVDFPHNYSICGNKVTENKNITMNIFEEKCTAVAAQYNQPCDSISYFTTKEEKTITISKYVVKPFSEDEMEETKTKITEHDCKERKIWKPECSTIDIEVLFDRFEITNFTYNAKFESLEVLSVIGGYMGMWLGFSLVSVYDFIGTLLGLIQKCWMKRLRKKRRRNRVTDNNPYSKRRKAWDRDKGPRRRNRAQKVYDLHL